MTFLRLPPFPGHRAGPLVVAGPRLDDPAELIAVVRQERVGGAFWVPPVALPPGRDIVLAPCTRAQAHAMIAQAMAEGVAERCLMLGRWRVPEQIARMTTPVNPWQIVGSGMQIRAGAGHDLAVISGDMALTGQGRDPFTGRAITLVEVARMLGIWRRGIEANRNFDAVQGVARWKRTTMAPMLWDGGGAVPFGRRGTRVLGWQARMRGAPQVEVEDGFIRSAGLGARCVPPLSVVVDEQAHVDPARESGLERILNEDMDKALIARAAALRARLVAGGIGKYGAGGVTVRRDMRRCVLVCGQVEDDRAMLLGGAGVTNLALLQRARAMEPDAQIIWRPHPDVEAGLRRGAIPAADLARLADRVERGGPLASLLAQVDVVHVVCSLAGFEALLRGVPVVTHGVPFYAGWGLTRDLGPVPRRRARRLTLDALVAGALVLYPRYVDPVTLLPCEVEVVVGRMEQGRAGVRSLWSVLVAVRWGLGVFRKRQAGGVTPPAPPLRLPARGWWRPTTA
jgi:capsular polysaccharide export protein